MREPTTNPSDILRARWSDNDCAVGWTNIYASLTPAGMRWLLWHIPEGRLGICESWHPDYPDRRPHNTSQTTPDEAEAYQRWCKARAERKG